MNIEKVDPIISLTDAACAHIQNYTSKLGETAGFRITTKKSGCSGFSYSVDVVKSPLKGDLHFIEKNIHVFIPIDSVDILNGTVIDCIDKGRGQRRLTFENPNAESFCGCGESFTLKNQRVVSGE